MNVIKFNGADIKEALGKLRAKLGSDAVILSNRTVGGRVELLGIQHEGLEALTSEVAFSSALTRGRIEQDEGWDSRGHSDQMLAQMMSKIDAIRDTFGTKLSEMAWDSAVKRDPAKADVMRGLLAAGFTASMARFLADKQPDGTVHADPFAWVKGTLARNLTCISDEKDMLANGGIFALVGPTGVGKTTTTAKLAARCVMAHGAANLVLITTDTFRIGAVDQLRIFGKMMGVLVLAVKDDADLRIALGEMKNKRTILIDTVGVGQRDAMVAEQIAMLSGPGAEVKRLLCLSATAGSDNLNEVIKNYSGYGLTGCIMTKMDEAATIGGVLDVLIRNKLPLCYVANGQRVPEDLCVKTSAELVAAAFELKETATAYHVKREETGSLAGHVPDSHTQALAEVVKIG